ncbi:hypothetical protein KIL84_008060, partial [Mauremys mutica]
MEAGGDREAALLQLLLWAQWSSLSLLLPCRENHHLKGCHWNKQYHFLDYHRMCLCSYR